MYGPFFKGTVYLLHLPQYLIAKQPQIVIINNSSSSTHDIFFKEVNFTTVMERLRSLGILIFVTLLLAPVYTVESDREAETFQKILHRFDNCEC